MWKECARRARNTCPPTKGRGAPFHESGAPRDYFVPTLDESVRFLLILLDEPDPSDKENNLCLLRLPYLYSVGWFSCWAAGGAEGAELNC